MFNRFNRFRKKKKTTVNTGADNSRRLFSVYNPHTLPAPVYSNDDREYIQIGSIDPAIHYFGLRCERIYKSGKRETIDFSLTDFAKPNELKIPEVGKENFY